VNVSEVHLAPDSRSARVMVVVAGDDAQAEETMEGLQAANGYVRRELVNVCTCVVRPSCCLSWTGHITMKPGLTSS